jgi:hypothetical protein
MTFNVVITLPLVFRILEDRVIQVFLWVTRSVFYSMSLPLALCQWRRNLQLQVHKMRYRGHLPRAGLPASGREHRPGQGSS